MTVRPLLKDILCNKCLILHPIMYIFTSLQGYQSDLCCSQGRGKPVGWQTWAAGSHPRLGAG